MVIIHVVSTASMLVCVINVASFGQCGQCSHVAGIVCVVTVASMAFLAPWNSKYLHILTFQPHTCPPSASQTFLSSLGVSALLQGQLPVPVPCALCLEGVDLGDSLTFRIFLSELST